MPDQLRFSLLIFLIAFSPDFAAKADPLSACGLVFDRYLNEPNVTSEFDGKIRKLRTDPFIILNTEQLFPTELMREIYNLIPGEGTIYLGGTLPERSLYNYTKGILTDEQIAPFRRFSAWLENSINAALAPDERVQLQMSELRKLSSKNSTRRGNINFHPWHTDGNSYITATIGLIGEGTYFTRLKNVYYHVDEQSVSITPRGQTIIFNGVQRTRANDQAMALSHSSPTKPQDRLVFFIQFEQAP